MEVRIASATSESSHIRNVPAEIAFDLWALQMHIKASVLTDYAPAFRPAMASHAI